MNYLLLIAILLAAPAAKLDDPGTKPDPPKRTSGKLDDPTPSPAPRPLAVEKTGWPPATLPLAMRQGEPAPTANGECPLSGPVCQCAMAECGNPRSAALPGARSGCPCSVASAAAAVARKARVAVAAPPQNWGLTDRFGITWTHTDPAYLQRYVAALNAAPVYAAPVYAAQGVTANGVCASSSCAAPTSARGFRFFGR